MMTAPSSEPKKLSFALWEKFARRTTQGDWEANGIDTLKRARPGLKPETPVKGVEKNKSD